MKKKVVMIMMVFFWQNCSVLHSFEKPLGLYKKIALSSVVLSGAMSSLMLMHKKIHKPLTQLLGSACVSVCAGATLISIWKKQHTNNEKDFFKTKVAPFLTLMDTAAKVHVSIGQTESSERDAILYTLKLNYAQAVQSQEIYKILQYDQQLLKRHAYALKRKKIKELVDMWYQGCESDAIIDHMRQEITKVFADGEQKNFLCSEIKSFFNRERCLFSAGLYTEEEHRKIVKEIRKKEHWVLLKNEEIKNIIVG